MRDGGIFSLRNTDLGTKSPKFVTPALAFLALGIALVVLPTMSTVATDSWSSEQGAHGPIVLMTGIWLLQRALRLRPPPIQRGNLWIALPALLVLLTIFCTARIGGIIEIEAIAMYFALVMVAYALWGMGPLRVAWFPLIYLLFIFPPPDSLFAMITQPMKIFVSYFSTICLQFAGYPVVSSGVTIQIAQYQLMVAAACAGLNSLISLTALGLFYTYVRHSSKLGHMLMLVAFILPIAIMANVIRVLILLLITYHFGEAAGQGFFHETAGLIMFASALLGIFGVDTILNWVERRWDKKRATV